MKKNRARISATVYNARIELSRLRSGTRALTVLPWQESTHQAQLKIATVINATELSEAQGACLALRPVGGKESLLELAVPLAQEKSAELWRRRIAELQAKKPRPALWVDVVFQVVGELAIAGKSCAAGEVLGVRLLDGESGEVLGERREASLAADSFEPRRLHAALSGVKAVTADSSGLEEYLSLLRSRIAGHFTLLARASEKVATVRIYVGPDGALLPETTVVTKSGDEDLDRAVLTALKQAAPFPPPPAKLTTTLRNMGAVLQFKR